MTTRLAYKACQTTNFHVCSHKASKYKEKRKHLYLFVSKQLTACQQLLLLVFLCLLQAIALLPLLLCCYVCRAKHVSSSDVMDDKLPLNLNLSNLSGMKYTHPPFSSVILFEIMMLILFHQNNYLVSNESDDVSFKFVRLKFASDWVALLKYCKM